MPERGNTGFNKHQELISRMKDVDPEHSNGWDELGDFAEFLARNGKISRTIKDPLSDSLIPLENPIVKFKYFDFDIGGHSVLVEGERTDLTKMNFDLLNYLISRKNKVVGRVELIEKVWENYASGPTVSVHIHKLRSILKNGRGIPEIIKTIRGVGYMFVDEESNSENT